MRRSTVLASFLPLEHVRNHGRHGISLAGGEPIGGDFLRTLMSGEPDHRQVRTPTHRDHSRQQKAEANNQADLDGLVMQRYQVDQQDRHKHRRNSDR